MNRRLQFRILLLLVTTSTHALAEEGPSVTNEADAAAARPSPSPSPSTPSPTRSFETLTGPLRSPPLGRAAPPTEAASHGEGLVRPGLEVIASYNYQNLTSQNGTQSWYRAFELRRAHAAIEAELDRARGRLVLEAVRSAAEGALVGVAGDSLVMRVREAHASTTLWGTLDVQGGVIPTGTIPEFDGTWMLRAVAPSALESSGLVSPADLGGRIRTVFPKGHGYISVSAYNGEGYASRELNRGKSVEISSAIHPFAIAAPALLPLAIFGSFVGGSTGTTKARADRVSVGLLWQGARLRGGAYGTYATGVRDLATQHGIVASAFVRAEPVERLLLGLRADHHVRNTEAPSADTLTTILGSAGWRIAESLEAFVSVTRSLPSARAQASLPGTDAWETSGVMRFSY
jgi:hypothetical protein